MFAPDCKCNVSVVERPAHGGQCCVWVKLAVGDTKHYVTQAWKSSWQSLSWVLLLVLLFPSPVGSGVFGLAELIHYLVIPKYAAILSWCINDFELSGIVRAKKRWPTVQELENKPLAGEKRVKQHESHNVISQLAKSDPNWFGVQRHSVL